MFGIIYNTSHFYKHQKYKEPYRIMYAKECRKRHFFLFGFRFLCIIVLTNATNIHNMSRMFRF